MLQQQISLCVLDNFCENLPLCNRIFVTTTRCTNSVRFNFWRILAATRNSVVHKVICHCDVSLHLVAATSRPTCTQGIICHCNVLLQLVTQSVLTFIARQTIVIILCDYRKYWSTPWGIFGNSLGEVCLFWGKVVIHHNNDFNVTKTHMMSQYSKVHVPWHLLRKK